MTRMRRIILYSAAAAALLTAGAAHASTPPAFLAEEEASSEGRATLDFAGTMTKPAGGRTGFDGSKIRENKGAVFAGPSAGSGRAVSYGHHRSGLRPASDGRLRDALAAGRIPRARSPGLKIHAPPSPLLTARAEKVRGSAGFKSRLRRSAGSLTKSLPRESTMISLAAGGAGALVGYFLAGFRGAAAGLVLGLMSYRG